MFWVKYYRLEIGWSDTIIKLLMPKLELLIYDTLYVTQQENHAYHL